MIRAFTSLAVMILLNAQVLAVNTKCHDQENGEGDPSAVAHAQHSTGHDAGAKSDDATGADELPCKHHSTPECCAVAGSCTAQSASTPEPESASVVAGNRGAMLRASQLFESFRAEIETPPPKA